MKEFWQRYKYVRYINGCIEEYIGKNTYALTSNVGEDTIMLPSMVSHKAVDSYHKKTGLSVHQVNTLSASACRKDYLHEVPQQDGKVGLRLGDKGRVLLDLPVGFLQCFSEELGRGATVLISILVAVIPNLWRLWH